MHPAEPSGGDHAHATLPNAALDQPTREDMRALLQEILASLEIPAIHVTHDRDEALTIGHNIAIIAAGQLRQTGPASQVTAQPAGPDTARLLGWTQLVPRPRTLFV
jgi:ABC-type Fe3+/spermidine/putrescine transport system ATPase subunit